MDGKEASAVLQEHINKSIAPMAEMIAELLMALGAVINELHKQGIVPSEDMQRALRETMAALTSENSASQSGQTLERLIKGVEQLRSGQSPTFH